MDSPSSLVSLPLDHMILCRKGWGRGRQILVVDKGCGGGDACRLMSFEFKVAEQFQNALIFYGLALL